MKNPRTKPTQEDTEQMKKAARELVDLFGGISQFCHVFDLKYWTVSSWLTRGRIPAQLAERLHSDERVIKLGIGKHHMRPDIKAWEFENE